jgi:DNA polymerase alpha subunit B
MAADAMPADASAGDTAPAFNGLFHMPGSDSLPTDILGELQSIARINDIDPQEVFYKWESYAMKMGAADTKLDLSSVRAFKTDVMEGLEREAREKASAVKASHGEKHRVGMGVGATPRAMATNGGDFLGM